MRVTVKKRFAITVVVLLSIALSLLYTANGRLQNPTPEARARQHLQTQLDHLRSQLNLSLIHHQNQLKLLADLSLLRLPVTARQQMLERFPLFLMATLIRMTDNEPTEEILLNRHEQLRQLGFSFEPLYQRSQFSRIVRERPAFAVINLSRVGFKPLIALWMKLDDSTYASAVLETEHFISMSAVGAHEEFFILNREGEVLVSNALEKTQRQINMAQHPLVYRWLTANNTLTTPLLLPFENGQGGVSLGGIVETPNHPLAMAYTTASIQAFATTPLFWPLLLIWGLAAIAAWMIIERAAKPIKQEWVQLQNELEERAKKLILQQQQIVQSEKMSAFGQMSAGIAHEVKVPLANILGYTQLAQRAIQGKLSDKGLEKYLEIIEKETQRCKEIIDGLMKFARQETGQMQALHLNQLLKDSLKLVEHQLTMHQVHVETQFADAADLPAVVGYPNQLQQVFTNLLLNAQQAMKDGGQITISTHAGANEAIIQFTDNGPGIAPENLARIFDPFFTTKPAGEGTGLGLAVSYGIIRDHHGRIEARSELGQGASFAVHLPAKDST